MTTPNEIAASAAIAISTGTSGEAPPSLPEDAGLASSATLPDPSELL